jgi:hypothetical protein
MDARMKEILDKPTEPSSLCSMDVGVFVGLYDEQAAGGSSPPTPVDTFVSGVLGQSPLGLLVLGAPEGF